MIRALARRARAVVDVGKVGKVGNVEKSDVVAIATDVAPYYDYYGNRFSKRFPPKAPRRFFA